MPSHDRVGHHAELAPHYPNNGRPSIDPELMIRMLIVGYVFAIGSERALCRDTLTGLGDRGFGNDHAGEGMTD
jgi:transposase